MTTTANLELPELDQGQTGADITHNEALDLLDVIVQLVVQNMTTIASGSATATEGFVYIPATGASGDWDATWVNKLAAYLGGAWVKITPKSGWSCFDLDTQKQYTYNGSSWDLTKMEPEVIDTEFRVLKSTDATSKMDFDMSKVQTGVETTFIMPNGDVTFAKTKLDGTAAPTVNNDNTEDYEPGSIWVDQTNNKGWLCVDNTATLAIWREMAGASGTGDVSNTGSTSVDNEIVRFDGTGGKTIQSGTTVVIDDDSTLYGNNAKIVEITGNTTLTDADTGKIIVLATTGVSADVTVSLPTGITTVGIQYTLINRNATYKITIAKQGSDVLESKNSYVDLFQHGATTVVKLDNTTVNTWGLYGDLE